MTSAQQETPATGDLPQEFLSGSQLATVVFSLLLGVFVVSLDTSIIGVVIPFISSHFHALDDAAWYGSAYLLAITAFQPLMGSMYKFFQVERVFQICLVIFELGSILCATAKTSAMFIVGRAIAGTGAAGILQGALSIISLTVIREKRPMYQGIVISVFVISVCIGPVLGGAFTTHGIWRWCFWINVPVGGTTLVLLLFVLRIRKAENRERSLSLKEKLRSLDYIGCVVFIGAVCSLLLALQWAGQVKPWNSATIIGLFVGFGLLSILFISIQNWQQDKALIPLRLIRLRSIWTSGGVLFCLGMATFAVTYYMPYYFQAARGISVINSGIDLIPVFIPQILAIVAASLIVTQWGYFVPLMIAGELICIVGTVLLTRLNVSSSTIYWAAALVVYGVGMGLAMQLPYTAVNVTLDEDDIPTGNAIAVFSWQLGGAIGIAIAQTIALNNILHEVPRRIPELSPKRVMSWGAANIQNLAPSTDELAVLRIIWCSSVVHVIYLALVFLSLSVVFTVSMEWLNVKRIRVQRREAVESSD